MNSPHARAVFALLAATLQPVDPFTCPFGGGAFLLTVDEAPPFPYFVSGADGAPWLENGTIAIAAAGALQSPGAGLSPGAPSSGAGSDALGAYSYLSIPWRGIGVVLVANFTCYARGVAAFTASFPDGVASLGAPGLAADSPATRFPSFAAGAGAAVRSSAMGFVEWAGEMDTYSNAHGAGLNGYGGGRSSGPLLLFNRAMLELGASKPPALVLGPGGGPGTHVAHGIIKAAADAVTEAAMMPVDPGCLGLPHTDEVGANSAPGTGGGILVPAGNASACCAACRALGAVCDSWVFDTDGEAGGSNCWPLMGIKGSKQGMADRVLGVCGTVACAAQERTLATGGVPSEGFAEGVVATSPDQCCVACATLGASACAAWSFNATSSVCTPLASFTGTSPGSSHAWFGVAVKPPQSLVAGVQGAIASLPPRFASIFLLAGSATGLNDAVYAYGGALQDAAGVQKIAREDDVQRNLLSYWSDNGAYYFDGYWPLFFDAETNTAEDVFTRLKEYHASLNLTVGTYQMDPYWYGGQCGAGAVSPKCSDKGWPWAANWTAASDLFPSGLTPIALPLTLYSNSFATPPVNEMTHFSWLNCSTCFGGVPPYAHVIPEQSLDFHNHLFDVGATWGMNAFEVDFADFVFLGFEDFSTDVRAYDAYMAGLDAAARDHGFPVQLCMSLPAITLSSVQWPQITNARLQGDGYATNTERYDIFQTALLYGAVGLAPFLDNIWTTPTQPSWDNAFGNATSEGDVEALAAIAAFSAGPVGFADGLGFTNTTLLAMVSRTDGVLLQPSLPATNIEAYFADAVTNIAGTRARIVTAPSFVPLAGAVHDAPPVLFLSLLAVFVAAPVPVAPVDVWPPLMVVGSSSAPGSTIVAYRMTALSHRSMCVDGTDATASGCAARFVGMPTDTLLTADTGAAAHEVFSVSPVFSAAACGSGSGSNGDGWSLLGELEKFTRVSPSRVVSVDTGCAVGGAPSVCVTVVGAPGEAVALTLVDPLGAIRLARLTLSAAGGAQAVCGCNGASCACAQG